MMLTAENLHNYQKATVEHIINNRFCGVFLDMGLGKTVSTLTAINDLMFGYMDINSVLIVAPKRVVESVWEEEAQKWEHLKHLTFSKIVGNEEQRKSALKKKADVYLVSRDNITWLCKMFGYSDNPRLKKAANLPFDMVVVDELSSFKAHDSKRFKALRSARPTMRRFVGLTGTPAPNSLLDLWAQMFLIDMGERLEKTITSYRGKYFKPGRSNGMVVYEYKLLPDADKTIHNKISDVCISMKAKDYLDLPDCTLNYIKVSLTPDLEKRYKKFERDNVLSVVDAETHEITALNAAALSGKLLQFANGALYDDDHVAHDVHDLKIQALKDLIEDSQGQPILVAWAFQFDRDRIMRELKAYNPRELKTKADIDDWNAGKIRVLISHPASAGHGLNLQKGGHIIVWFGQTWSLEFYQQFNARLMRQGQQNHVIIHHIITEGTHDEDTVKALDAKSKTQDALMLAIKARIKKYLK